ncbi:hypothetical protein ACU4GH_30780 [Bradyrhizobium betae]
MPSSQEPEAAEWRGLRDLDPHQLAAMALMQLAEQGFRFQRH